MQRLYAYALPGLTARQLFNSSTLLDSSTELDRTRQSSTDLDTPAHRSQSRLASTVSTATRQLLDRLNRQGLDSTSTAARRSLDSSTAQQPGLNVFLWSICLFTQCLSRVSEITHRHHLHSHKHFTHQGGSRISPARGRFKRLALTHLSAGLGQNF